MTGDHQRKRGRPTRFGRFDRLLATCPKNMRRPKYHDRIGIRRGPKGDTVWVKGSRAVGLDRVVSALRSRFPQPAAVA